LCFIIPVASRDRKINAVGESMGEISRTIRPVKLFCSMFASDTGLFKQAEENLVRRWGPVDFRSRIFDFTQTDYYEEEMGTGLKRIFISFKKLIPREKIILVKIETNKLEIRLSKDQVKRKINLDPGYVTQANVSLATTKDYQHRIYLGKGIYLENTLRMRKGRWDDWEWTYPDYKTAEYKDWFMEVLQLYKEKITSIRI
jgi:hypothetical protein